MRTLKGFCTLLMVAALIASCAPTPQATTAPGGGGATGDKVVKIATQSPLSGGSAAVGEGIKNGAQLAVEQLSGPLKDLGSPSRSCHSTTRPSPRLRRQRQED